MDKAKSSLNIEKGVWRCWGGVEVWTFVCVLGGFEKSVRSMGGCKIWLQNWGPDCMSRLGSLCRAPVTLAERNKNQLCDYMNNRASPVSWDPVIVISGSRVEIFQVITLAGRLGEWTKRETGQQVTHCSCALLPRFMWLGPYCKLYCHAVYTWKLWNLPLSWFVYKRIQRNLINQRFWK